MEDGKEDPSANMADENPEPQTQQDDPSHLNTGNRPTLREASAKLKAEALRRYKMTHPQDEGTDDPKRVPHPPQKPQPQGSPGLQRAASKLKAEALRRYRERHRDSLDRHERELLRDFADRRYHSEPPTHHTIPLVQIPSASERCSPVSVASSRQDEEGPGLLDIDRQAAAHGTSGPDTGSKTKDDLSKDDPDKDAKPTDPTKKPAGPSDLTKKPAGPTDPTKKPAGPTDPTKKPAGLTGPSSKPAGPPAAGPTGPSTTPAGPPSPTPGPTPAPPPSPEPEPADAAPASCSITDPRLQEQACSPAGSSRSDRDSVSPEILLQYAAATDDTAPPGAHADHDGEAETSSPQSQGDLGQTEQSEQNPDVTDQSDQGPGQTDQSDQGPGQTDQSDQDPGQTDQSDQGPGQTEESEQRPGEANQSEEQEPGQTDQSQESQGPADQSDGQEQGQTDPSEQGNAETSQSEQAPGQADQSEQDPAQPDLSEQAPAQPDQSEQAPAQPDQSEQAPAQPDQSEQVPAQPDQSEQAPGQADQSEVGQVVETQPATQDAGDDEIVPQRLEDPSDKQGAQVEVGAGSSAGSETGEFAVQTEADDGQQQQSASSPAGGATPRDQADTTPKDQTDTTPASQDKTTPRGEEQTETQQVFGETGATETTDSQQPQQETPQVEQGQGQGQEQGEGQGQTEEQGQEEDQAEEEDKEHSDETPVDGKNPDIRGDEYEVQSEELLADDNQPKIPDDFYYDFNEMQSKPLVSEESGLPSDLLKLHHSFGYDCHKRANLHMLDEKTAVFAAGNILQLLNLTTREQTYMRTTSGGGIGAIAVHPSKKYFAVAEKGSAPNINIFEYPSLRLHRVLRGGTEEAYSYVSFSPDGRLLASVGADPDYMLTLWNWKQEQIVLRSKAFSQDIFRVSFSSELEGQLTSAGTGHIRFWKMARTFTGLKLQGVLGKFGKTEISDIEGHVELPDGKVLSGCESGNLLLWDGGLIKVEISRKNKKTCHVGPIQQVVMDEGEVLTVGVDGYIRVWDFETIDTADVTDESAIFEMEPMNELKVGSDVQLRSIVKSGDSEGEVTVWYAQDMNGGIWKLDLSFSFTSQAPEKMMTYHSGPISGCDTSPLTHLVATTGVDKTVRVYDYVSKEYLCQSKYNSPGTSLVWLPQTVDPKASTILVGFQDGVVRALNFQKKETVDVHGRKHKDRSELALAQAFKPHNAAVTAMAVDSKGEILATGSSDNTVFFLSLDKQYEPVGFIKTPAPVSNLQWSPSSQEESSLLVSCSNGHVLQVTSPESSNYDTSHSYEITGLKTHTHKFKSIKSRLRHEEDMARRAKEAEDRRRAEEAERRLRIERGQETESEQGDEEDGASDAGSAKEEEEVVEEEEWEPWIPEEPSPILQGFHAKAPGRFWLSMGGFDAGYLYECEFLEDSQLEQQPDERRYEPTRTMGLSDSTDTPIQCVTFSRSGKYMLMGLANGAIRVQTLQSDDVGLMGPFYTLSVHDNQYGQITHLALSHDDKYLFTVGADGNFFTFELMAEDKMREKVAIAKAKIPSARKDLADKLIDDIEDKGVYSIEDAKQKSEYDKMMASAEQKKKTVKQTIDRLREQFQQLIDRNNVLPQHLRLHQKEFELDAEIKAHLEQQKQEMIETVHKEMAWEAEKHNVALNKLRARFKDVVECERIVVKAFLTRHEVSSFRASKLSDGFYVAQAEMERRRTTLLSKEEASRQATRDSLKAGTGGSEAGGEVGEQEGEDVKITTSLKGSMGERITKALARVEEKKKKRAARRAQWEELRGSKPDDNYEDPADVAAIKSAQDNMGDYKLKSADDYVVPDNLRMNTDKARSRLLMLKDLIHQHKYDFNQQLLRLRDKKLRLIGQIRDLVTQLQDVQGQLGPEHHRPVPEVPEMHPEELPERKYEYTRETLLQFKEELAARQDQSQQGASDGFTGFGKATAQQPVQSTAAASSQQAHRPQSVVSDGSNQAPQAAISDLELRMRKALEIRLLYERDRLNSSIQNMLQNFDAELRCLRHDKFKMDIDLKNADLRQVTLFEELLLLKDFEKQENVIADRVEAKQQEKLDMQAKVIEVQARQESKRKDIERLQEKEKALHATFLASLGDNNKFADYLTKVFKKKIKRTKKKANEGEGDSDESDEDSDDDSDWSESEEESDSEAGGYDLDVCPQGCDQSMYDNTCAMREKRLDIEEALAEEKKNRDQLGKDLDGLQKKAKVIDGSLKNAENELEAFQLEKQRKLNELDVVVTQKLHQVQYLAGGALPPDLSPCLVFQATGLVRLTHRIKELEREKALQKKQQKEAKKKHVQLIKDRRTFDQRITEMNEQCNKMMLQKFGRVVDLEKLEQVTVNRQIEELKDKLRVHELQCSTELNQWDDRIEGAKDDITSLIRENTNRLEQQNMLLVEQRQFGHSLDARQNNLKSGWIDEGGEYSGVRKADVHERQRLIQLVHLQAQEVEALKDEISLLSRKGGHILPPAQPPLPPGQTDHT